MVCKGCGNVIDEKTTFCTYCGNKTPTKKLKGNLIGIFLGVVIFLSVVYLDSSTVSTDEIESIILRNKIHNFHNQEMELESVEIISQENNGEGKSVICSIYASNDIMFVEQTCELMCEKTKGEWSLIDYKTISIDNVEPKCGVERNEYHINFEEADLIEALYPDIEWWDENTGLSRGLGTTIVSKEIDLREKTERLICDYNIASNTSKIKGEMEYNYIFEDGVWKMDSVYNRNTSFDWDLERIYNFQIEDEDGNYICALNIETLDVENQRAHIYYYGSPFEEFTGYYTGDCWIDFIEENERIVFDTFVIKTTSTVSKYIKFIATIEDLYYTCSSNDFSTDTLGKPVGGVQ